MPSPSLQCPGCRQWFVAQGNLTLHRRSCPLDLKRSFSSQRNVRDMILAKRQRMDDESDAASSHNVPLFPQPHIATPPVVAETASIPPQGYHHSPSPAPQDLDEPIAMRKRSRIRYAPSKFADFVPSQIKRVQKTQDVFPQPPTGLPMTPVPEPSSSSSASLTTKKDSHIDSPKNIFGLFRRYRSSTFPTHDPDVGMEEDSFVDTPDTAALVDFHDLPSEVFHPYPNKSAFLLGRWQHSGKPNKSMNEFRRLLKVLRTPGFKLSELWGVDFRRITRLLGHHEVRS